MGTVRDEPSFLRMQVNGLKGPSMLFNVFLVKNLQAMVSSKGRLSPTTNATRRFQSYGIGKPISTCLDKIRYEPPTTVALEAWVSALYGKVEVSMKYGE